MPQTDMCENYFMGLTKYQNKNLEKLWESTQEQEFSPLHQFLSPWLHKLYYLSLLTLDGDTVYRNIERCNMSRKRKILLASWFMLALSTIMILTDQVICLLLHKAIAVTWKFVEFKTDKSFESYFCQFYLKNQNLHTPNRHIREQKYSSVQSQPQH